MMVVLGAALACSSGSPTGVEGTCIAVVNVDGTFMTSVGDVVAADSVTTTYLEVSRNTGCLDQGEPSDPLQSGESNFLPTGTELHRVIGFEPTERLAYRIGTGEWLLLASVPLEVTLAVGDEVGVPGTVLRLALTDILSDSRCPIDATCVWAGDVEVEIGTTLGTGPTVPDTLHYNEAAGPTSVERGGYRVRLVSVDPVARADVTIPVEAYRLRFRIEG